MKKKTLWTIFGVIILVAVCSAVFYKYHKQAVTPDTEKVENMQVDAIRSFMNEPNLMFEYQGLQHPSNFTVGITSTFPNGGDGRTDTPAEWERGVYVYTQKNLAESCQFYTYEVDARNSKIVQVQLTNSNVGVNPDAVYDQSTCYNKLKILTPDEVKQVAFGYLQRNITNFASIQDKFSFRPLSKGDTSDRYELVYQDTSYVLPAGLTSEPYKYPTIRMVISDQGYIMTYLNTTSLFPSRP